jgi:hypothetical protein
MIVLNPHYNGQYLFIFMASTFCFNIPKRLNALLTVHYISQASATHGTHAKRGTRNDFQCHAE